jgi:hypothetical protein
MLCYEMCLKIWNVVFNIYIYIYIYVCVCVCILLFYFLVPHMSSKMMSRYMMQIGYICVSDWIVFHTC